MKPTIELDTEEDNADWKANNLVNADDMRLAIETFYDQVLRPYTKYHELTAGQDKIIKEIIEGSNEHFKEFLE